VLKIEQIEDFWGGMLLTQASLSSGILPMQANELEWVTGRDKPIAMVLWSFANVGQ
jgi:hypothetical protein